MLTTNEPKNTGRLHFIEDTRHLHLCLCLADEALRDKFSDLGNALSRRLLLLNRKGLWSRSRRSSSSSSSSRSRSSSSSSSSSRSTVRRRRRLVRVVLLVLLVLLLLLVD